MNVKCTWAQRAVVCLMIFGMLLGSMITCFAASGSTTVSYTSEAESAYELIVQVNGFGSVSDGERTIRNNGVIYQMAVNESKWFQITPDKKNKVKSILLDGEDITQKVNNQKLELIGVKKNQELIINFTTISSNVETGDTTQKLLLIAVMFITGAMIVVFVKKKKEEVK